MMSVKESNANELAKLTIITVTLNCADSLEKTVVSVLSQNYPNIEYIVIDGGSTDGTVEIIRKYSKRLSYWSSGIDKGLYDAMNKGLDHSTGDGCLFINAGDYFVGNVLESRLSFPCQLRVKYRLGKYLLYPRKEYYRFGLPYCHQGIIFKRTQIRFDIQYKYAADYKYYLDNGYRNRLPRQGAKGYVYYDNSGVSNKNATLRDMELKEIIGEYNGEVFAYAFLLQRWIIGKTKSILKLAGVKV